MYLVCFSKADTVLNPFPQIKSISFKSKATFTLTMSANKDTKDTRTPVQKAMDRLQASGWLQGVALPPMQDTRSSLQKALDQLEASVWLGTSPAPFYKGDCMQVSPAPVNRAPVGQAPVSQGISPTTLANESTLAAAREFIDTLAHIQAFQTITGSGCASLTGTMPSDRSKLARPTTPVTMRSVECVPVPLTMSASCYAAAQKRKRHVRSSQKVVASVQSSKKVVASAYRPLTQESDLSIPSVFTASAEFLECLQFMAPLQFTPSECPWELMRATLSQTFGVTVELVMVQADGSCGFHTFDPVVFGGMQHIRRLSFFAHIMDKDMLDTMKWHQLAGILCEDGAGNARPTKRIFDWIDESSWIKLLQMFLTLDTLIIVSLSTKKQPANRHDKGFALRFQVYVASEAAPSAAGGRTSLNNQAKLDLVRMCVPRKVDATYNASNEFVKDAIQRSNGLHVVGKAMNHYCRFDDLDLTQMMQRQKNKARRG